MSNLDQLIAERDRIQQQIEAVKQQERGSALEQARELVKKYGITAKELGLTGGAKGATGSRGTVAAKYRNPVDGSTWTGRGKSPRWIREAEARGQSRDSFLIK